MPWTGGPDDALARIARTFVSVLLFAFALLAAGTADARERGASDEGEALLVATREAPPFAMRDGKGGWDGIAIELWRSIADQNGYEYRFVEVPLADMTGGVSDGRYDVSVGALTITPVRETQIDFTHPFYATGFGIALRADPPSWLSLIRAMVSADFLRIVLVLCLLLLGVGILFWLTERRHNSEEFPEDPRGGIGAGFWFSAVTMTTVGYGDKAPRSVGGRLVALVWMFSALIITSLFTGLVASSLTTGRLSASVAGPSDLDRHAVGSVRGSAGDEWLSHDGIATTEFETLEEALAALDEGSVDAVVHDYPLLRYSVRRNHPDELKVLPGSFGRQDYAIALPQGSDMREDVNLALLRHIDGDRWLGRLNDTLEND